MSTSTILLQLIASPVRLFITLAAVIPSWWFYSSQGFINYNPHFLGYSNPPDLSFDWQKSGNNKFNQTIHLESSFEPDYSRERSIYRQDMDMAYFQAPVEYRIRDPEDMAHIAQDLKDGKLGWTAQVVGKNMFLNVTSGQFSSIRSKQYNFVLTDVTKLKEIERQQKIVDDAVRKLSVLRKDSLS